MKRTDVRCVRDLGQGLSMAISQVTSLLVHGSVVVGTLLLAGCDRASLQWSEQVRLQNGQMIVVERTAQGRTFSELGGIGGWRDPVNMSVAITQAPDEIEPAPEWRDDYAPLLLDYDASKQSWTMLATFNSCETWYALGRPIPPYIAYQTTRGSSWRRVPIDERFVDQLTNLLTGIRTDGEPDLVTIVDKEFRQRSAVPRFQKILRKWGREEANFCDLS